MRKNEARPICLVGPMGAGKSTIGPLLAERLGRLFVDSDREIEARTGRSIPEIFAAEGEATFRQLEAETIRTLSCRPIVIALGGGALLNPGSLEWLLDRGDLVYLRASTEVLVERMGDSSGRPLLDGLSAAARIDRLRGLLVERAPLYERAPIQVDAEAETEEVVERIVAALGSRPKTSERIAERKERTS